MRRARQTRLPAPRRPSRRRRCTGPSGTTSRSQDVKCSCAIDTRSSPRSGDPVTPASCMARLGLLGPGARSLCSLGRTTACIIRRRAPPRSPSSAASALEPSGPPACAMSGRPPPPLPPSASAPFCTRSTALKREVRSSVTPTTMPALPSSDTADNGDDAGADLLLALVGEAAQVLELDAGDRARDELHAVDLTHAVGAARRGRAAAHGELLPRVGQFALELLALVEQRGQPRRQVLQRRFEFRGRGLGDLRLMLGALARDLPVSASRRRTPAATPESPTHGNQPDIAGAPDMRAAAQFDRPAERIGLRVAALIPDSRPSRPRAPRRRISRRTARARRTPGRRRAPSAAW